MISDDERAWLDALHNELYPPKKEPDILAILLGNDKPVQPRERITHAELDRICDLIRREHLVTALFPCGYVCGVGMHIYEQEQLAVSKKPRTLISLVDERLPTPLRSRTWHEHLLDVPPSPKKERGAGDVDPEVWDFFTSFTHTDENRALLKRYKIDMHFDKFRYDY